MQKNENKNIVTDRFGRRFEKLRISLTSQCNMACTYCVPQSQGTGFRSNSFFSLETKVQEPLSVSELNGIIKKLVLDLHVKQVKLTGGEPLISPLIKPVVTTLNELGITDISLTTNGVHLASMARFLKENGVHKINVSLDTLEPGIFSSMTRTNGLKFVLRGIDVGQEVGLQIKLNSVIIKGVNEQEIIPLLEYAGRRGMPLRFLELMEMGELYGHTGELIYSQEEILNTIQDYTKITPVIREVSSTANYWETEKGYRFGVIANHTVPFCHDCNRLRLDSSGKIYGCITDERGIDVSKVTSPGEFASLLAEAMTRKQSRFMGSRKTMISFGG